MIDSRCIHSGLKFSVECLMDSHVRYFPFMCTPPPDDMDAEQEDDIIKDTH